MKKLVLKKKVTPYFVFLLFNYGLLAYGHYMYAPAPPNLEYNPERMTVRDPSTTTLCEELNSLWGKFHHDFGVAWEKEKFGCPSEVATFVKAIYDLYKPKLIKNNSGYAPDFYTWAKQGIRKTLYYRNGSEYLCECGMVEAPVDDHWNSSFCNLTGTIYLYPPLFEKIDPSFYEKYDYYDKTKFEGYDPWPSGTLIHETAHLYTSECSIYFDHTICSHGEYAGEAVCDRKLRDGFKGGSNNYEFLYYWWLLAGSQYNEINRSILVGLTSHMIFNHFNEVTDKQREKYSPKNKLLWEYAEGRIPQQTTATNGRI